MELYNIEDKNKYEVFIPSGIGEFYTQCPACSHKRKPINQKKRCLSFNRNKNIGLCHHCGARFVEFNENYASNKGLGYNIGSNPTTKQLNPPTTKHLNNSTPKQLTPPTPKQLNPSTPKQLNSSTTKPLNPLYIKLSLSLNSNFGKFLESVFNNKELEKIMLDYLLGATQNREVIYWYIDKDYALRSGKIMQYNSTTGKRIQYQSEYSILTDLSHKSKINHIHWVHSILKKQDKLPQNWEFNRCLFGEHLLRKYPTKKVLLFEGEKTAIICSIYFPNYVCLATGGSNMLSKDICEPLRHRQVLVLPDSDKELDWLKRVNEINSEMKLNLQFYSDIHKDLSSEQKSLGYDLADYLLLPTPEAQRTRATK